MTRNKDFGSGPNLDNIEPLSFTLHGETFDCVKQIQGKVLLSLVKDANANDVARSADTVEKFFDNVLLPESAERFNALLVDPNRLVPVETLAEIVNWLMEEYAGRPEEQPELS